MTEASSEPRRGTTAARLLVVLPIALSLALAARTASRDSCTIDEFGNLPLTVAYWRGHALHVDPGNPPLTRWIQGIPLLPQHPDLGCTRAELDSMRTSWELGYRFEDAHPTDYQALLVRARRGSIALLSLTVLGVFVLAGDLAGPGPAFGAALLTATCPNLLAHGRLVTPDIGLACFGVWAVWAALRARRDGRFATCAFAGLLAGAATLAKFSGLLFVVLLVLVVADAAREVKARALRAATFLGAALLVLYAGYGFPPPGLLHGWPTPLPRGVVEGIEAQLAEAPYPAYLLGHLREGGGWASYHVVAFLVKTPLPVLALLLFALWRVVRERRTEFAVPLLVAVVFFAAFGAATKKNVGLRYVLPVFPLAHVACAAAFGGRRRIVPWALTALAAASGISASRAPLASFNGVERFLGGKRAVLVDSNLDWGQALPDLRDWQRRNGIETVQLAYFGRVDPSIYGIRWRTLPSKPVRGPVAISATFAVGRPYSVLMKERPFLEATRAWSTAQTWSWIKDVPPEEELGGGAILVWKDVGPAYDAAMAAQKSAKKGRP
ncbi:MAG: glycosyltransferase family 39 protein [bacterium]